MLKNIVSQKQDMIRLLKNTKATILPFMEQPAANRDKEDVKEQHFNAIELFSLFTANIIKNEVVFLR